MGLNKGLSRIGLGGFQVFDKYTEIPLSRLTFLFGPNSAGKSSIEDALSVAQGIWSIDLMSDDLMRNLKKHWRRTGPETDDFVPSVQIDLTVDVSVELNESFCISSGRDLVSYGRESYESQQLTLRVTATRGDFRYFPHHGIGIQKREVLADGLPLFSYAPRGESYVNFSHPLFRDIDPLENFEEAATHCPEIFEFDNKMVRFKSESGIDLPYWRNPWSFQSDSLLFSEKSESALSSVFEGLKTPGALKSGIDVIPAIKEFAFFISFLDQLVSSCVTIGPDVVPASRQIPTPKDLTILVSGGPDADEVFGIASPFGDQRYLEVAESFVNSKLKPKISEFAEEATAEAVNERSIHEAVNLYLTDYLFIERGFGLNFDYLVLLSPNEYNHLVDGYGGEGGPLNTLTMPASIVRISLADSNGRRFSFEEVGSGLGYVLPVLCSVATRLWRPVLIQQPELHLHPALQAAMGDVLIDASHQGSSNLIVETHSEHLLLRVLKRVRHTSRGTQIPDQLRIASNEVTVLYFNPLPDGTSEVKHLRVSREGDFMDRWPRGFFEERDRELFDE